MVLIFGLWVSVTAQKSSVDCVALRMDPRPSHLVFLRRLRPHRAKLLHRLRDKASAPGEPRGTLSIAPRRTRDKETSPRELETYLGTYKRKKGRKSVRVMRERRENKNITTKPY